MTPAVSGPFRVFDHVQLAIPAGGEELARAFYGDLLGMREVVKPAALRSRGGAWFASGSVALHLGVETPFAPARKAHPALRCTDYAALVARLTAAGHYVASAGASGDEPAHGYVDDPFGNRIELIADTAA